MQGSIVDSRTYVVFHQGLAFAADEIVILCLHDLEVHQFAAGEDVVAVETLEPSPSCKTRLFLGRIVTIVARQYPVGSALENR